jgi:hypothetical protein
MNIGDLVRIVVPPYSQPDLYWTIAIVVEHLGRDGRGLDKFLIHCLYDEGYIAATTDKLELLEEE